MDTNKWVQNLMSEGKQLHTHEHEREYTNINKLELRRWTRTSTNGCKQMWKNSNEADKYGQARTGADDSKQAWMGLDVDFWRGQ